ncbi:MAG: carbohydrate kinase [Verrucomicrobiota bacterium]
MKPRIISLGEVLWDLFPSGARFGGAPANFACHAAALEGEVTMISAVGADDQGREALTILESFGIKTNLVQTKKNLPTGSVSIEIDHNGKPSYTIHEDIAWDYLEWDHEIESEINRADAIYFGTLGQRHSISRATIRQAVEFASNHGIPRILDVNLRSPFFDDSLIMESIEAASVLKLSDDEFEAVISACRITTTKNHEDSLRSLLDKCGLDLVVMTRGADGALLVTGDEIIDQPGIPTSVYDTVGAGDAFTASLVHGILREDPYPIILREACSLASEVCSRPGAVPTAVKPT